MGKNTRIATPTLPSGEIPVTLIGREGARIRYASARALVSALGWSFISERVGDQHDELVSHSDLVGYDHERGEHVWRRRQEWRRFDWVVRDATGRVVSRAELGGIDSDLRSERWAERRRRSRRLGRWGLWQIWDGEGPVPGTGRWKRGRVLRHPKTHGQNREGAWRDPEGAEPLARAKQRKLPTNWEDLFIHSQEVRSWKRHRAAQRKGSGARRGGGDLREQPL
jgi:hypothetical protein